MVKPITRLRKKYKKKKKKQKHLSQHSLRFLWRYKATPFLLLFNWLKIISNPLSFFVFLCFGTTYFLLIVYFFEVNIKGRVCVWRSREDFRFNKTMVGIFSRFTVGRSSHRRTQSAIVSSLYLGLNPFYIDLLFLKYNLREHVLDLCLVQNGGKNLAF